MSNYCYHHLSDRDKERGLAEAFGVLRPGDRLVVGDMMFRVQLGDPRSRQVVASKVRSLLRRGPAGLLRLLKNAQRLLVGRWEQPADSNWWRNALKRTGFADVETHLLEHEGGLITARRPAQTVRAPRHRYPRRASFAVLGKRLIRASSRRAAVRFGIGIATARSIGSRLAV